MIREVLNLKRKKRDLPDCAAGSTPQQRLTSSDHVHEEAKEHDRGNGLERAVDAGVE